MRIQIPKVVVAVSLAEYAPELQGQALHIWVNPSMEKLNEFRELVAQVQERELEKASAALISTPPAGNAIQNLIASLKHGMVTRRAVGVDEDLLRWYAEIWSQGPAGTQWSVAEIRTLEAQDPAFLSWMINQTWETRNAHMERKKKS